MPKVCLVEIHELVNVCQSNGSAALIDLGKLSGKSAPKDESEGRVEMCE